MNRNFKRNMVVATVMLFVCAAVYLNWKYAGNVAQTEEAVETKTLGESTLVSKTETDSDSSAADEAAVYGEDGDYFATARLTRQQARDNALSLLQEAAEEEGADQETLNSASEGIQALAAYTLQEAQIENLVTAKGYSDCVAFMGEDSLSVVVAPPESGELTAQDVAKITDIAMTETGYTADQIKIMPAN